MQLNNLTTNKMTMTAVNNISSVGLYRHEEARMTRKMSLIAGYYMMVVCALGVIENLLVLNTFRRNPKLRFVSTNMVKMLCVYDALMSMCAFPFTCASCLANEWIFSEAGCQWYGFAMTLLSLGSIFSLSCIALERFVVITCAVKDSPYTQNYSMKLVAITCSLMGIAFGLLPLFGIGTYDHETVFLSCSPVWSSKSKEDFLFIMLIFPCAFLLPVCLITFSYVGICIKVFSSRAVHRRKTHIKLVVLSSLMIASFLLSWTPYAVFAFLQAFSKGIELTAMENMIPVMMAKSCVLWNPLICVGGSEDFRKALKKDLKIMSSYIYDIFTKCHKRSRKNSNGITQIDNPNTGLATQDNHNETSDNQHTSRDVFQAEQNDTSESDKRLIRDQQNNDSTRASVEPYTYTYDFVECESSI